MWFFFQNSKQAAAFRKIQTGFPMTGVVWILCLSPSPSPSPSPPLGQGNLGAFLFAPLTGSARNRGQRGGGGGWMRE